MTPEEQANHLQRLKFKLDWLQMQIAQTQEQVGKLEAFEIVLSESEETIQDTEAKASGESAHNADLENQVIESAAS
jgi:prefoldin subunit 5